MARFEELRRGPRELVRDYVDALNSQDWGRLTGLYAPDLRFVDRRLIGWGELDGRDAFIEVLRGTLALGPDLHVDAELIALGRRAVVGRFINRGHLAEGGGEFEIALLSLALVEDGQVTYFELFESTDTASALARFEEIGTQTEPERMLARVCRIVNLRDWDALEELYTEDFEVIDHRLIGWEPIRGAAAMGDFFRSWLELVPDVEARFTVLSGDDEHAAIRYSGWGHAAEGGGPMEYATTQTVSLRDGRLWRAELFEADDEKRALARLAELQPVAAPAARPATTRERLNSYVAAWNAHDWDRVRELYAPDVRVVDRRLIGWGELHGPDAIIEPMRGTFALAPDMRLDLDILVSGERGAISRQTVRGHSAEGGGEFEVELYSVSTADDGLITYLELFDEAGLGAAYDCFEELVAVTEPERYAARYSRAHNAHDLDALRALYAEDCECVDHRSIGRETLRGVDAVMAMFSSWHETVPDLEDRVEVLASDDQRAALRVDGFGHAADGGGALEYFLAMVITMRDGRLWRAELFDAGEEEAALARFEELRREAAASAPGPPHRAQDSSEA
jgi:ketosteroid isomerase-like protein